VIYNVEWFALGSKHDSLAFEATEEEVEDLRGRMEGAREIDWFKIWPGVSTFSQINETLKDWGV